MDNQKTSAMDRLLLTGATGFVGSYLYPALVDAGYDVVCASRHPRRAAQKHPDRQWVHLDVDLPATIERAMEGCTHAVYLIHSITGKYDYERQEDSEARNFAAAAERAGLQRIVYLGGMRPLGTPSRHLRSRLHTGEVLRSGKVPTIELQASMLIGPGSASWRIVRDLSMRLPLMVLPRWLRSRSQPIAVEDAVVAICAALGLPSDVSGAFSLPGPEVLSGKEILQRVAALRDLRPMTLNIPVVTPKLSRYWIQWVTRADKKLAGELVQGLTSDLVANDAGFWKFLPEHECMTFDEAARRALEDEQPTLTRRARFAEQAVAKVSRHRDANRSGR